MPKLFKRRHQQRLRKKPKGADLRHPVRKAVACVLALALLGIIPVFENSALGYMPLIAYVVVLILAFLYPRIICRYLDYDLAMDRDSCPRDTDVALLVRFLNPTPLLCPRIDVEFRVSDIFGADDVVSSFSFSLGANKTRDFQFGAHFAHIGTVQAGVKKTVVYDPFGLFCKTIDQARNRTIEVTPRIYEVDGSLSRILHLQEAMESSTPFNKDGMDYTGVREYVYGDPLKSIHWKLSSHSDDELYTRLFETAGEPSLDILCSTAYGDYDVQTTMSLYDAELETALSIFDFGVHRGLHIKLVFESAAGGITFYDSAANPDHRDVLKDFPLPHSIQESGALAQLVLERSQASTGSNNLVICTASLDDALVDALASIDKGRCKIALFLLVAQCLDSTERRELIRPLRRLEQDNVVCFAFEQASELEGVTYG